eukprot:103566-Amphidinium_carterae.1
MESDVPTHRFMFNLQSMQRFAQGQAELQGRIFRLVCGAFAARGDLLWVSLSLASAVSFQRLAVPIAPTWRCISPARPHLG